MVNCYVNGAVSEAATKTVFHCYRWMGGWCAVYAPAFQEKAITTVERSRRKRRVTPRPAKRRGKESAQRRKKCRAVVRCDPETSGTPTSTGDIGIAKAIRAAFQRVRAEKRQGRINRYAERYSSWARKRVAAVAVLARSYSVSTSMLISGARKGDYASRLNRGDLLRDQKRNFDRLRSAKERLVLASMKHSGDSKDFTLMRINLLIQLASGETLDSLLSVKGLTHGEKMQKLRWMRLEDEPLFPVTGEAGPKPTLEIELPRGKRVAASGRPVHPLCDTCRANPGKCDRPHRSVTKSDNRRVVGKPRPSKGPPSRRT